MNGVFLHSVISMSLSREQDVGLLMLIGRQSVYSYLNWINFVELLMLSGRQIVCGQLSWFNFVSVVLMILAMLHM
jgi:hypothetical protein